MRTICDVCESAPAVLFCAADEAALCQSCDDKVHMCNKLANRHVRVRLADPSDVPLCDICENSPAFFYCEIDGSSLCLQCDMTVHVGGKQTHARYLLLRQRVEFPGINKPNNSEDMADTVNNNTKEGKLPTPLPRDAAQRHQAASESNAKMIDLNTWPRQTHGQPSNTQRWLPVTAMARAAGRFLGLLKGTQKWKRQSNCSSWEGIGRL